MAKPLHLKKIRPGQLVEFISKYEFYNDNEKWQGLDKFYPEVNVKTPRKFCMFPSGTIVMVVDVLVRSEEDYVMATMKKNLSMEVPTITTWALLVLKGIDCYVVPVNQYKEQAFQELPKDLKDQALCCYTIRTVS